MKCENCGAMNAEDAVFCYNCGNKVTAPVEVTVEVPVEAPIEVPVEAPIEATVEAPIEATVETPVETPIEATVETPIEAPVEPVVAEQPVNEAPVAANTETPTQSAKITSKLLDLKKKPKVLAAVVCVLALIILIVIIVASGSGSDYELKENTYSFIENDGDTMVLYEGKLLDKTIPGKNESSYHNFDGTVSLVLSSEDELFRVQKKKVESIATDVVDFTMAAEGEYALYLDDDNSLYLLKVSNGKETLIEDDVAGAKISPDGKAVIYTVTEKDEEKMTVSSELFLYVGKKSYSLGDDYSPISVSNDGKYVYASKEGKLYVFTKKGEEKETLCSDYSNGDSVYFNADRSQIVFYSKDGKTYVSTKGKEAEKISGSRLWPLFPEAVSKQGNTYNVDSLLDQAYESSDSLYVVNKKAESEKIANKIQSCEMTDDGKYVFFLKDVKNGEGELYKIKVKKGAEEKEIAEDVASYRIAKDGDLIYFKDNDGVLYGQKGTSKAKEIMEEVSIYSVTEKDVLLFIAEKDDSGNGTLYSCTNGKKAKKVDDDVRDFTVTISCAYYEIGDIYDYELFASNGGKSFKELTNVVKEKPQVSSGDDDDYDWSDFYN